MSELQRISNKWLKEMYISKIEGYFQVNDRFTIGSFINMMNKSESFLLLKDGKIVCSITYIFEIDLRIKEFNIKK